MKFIDLQNFIRKSTRFGLFIPISNLIVAYGHKILPKRFLSFISDRRNNKIQARLGYLVDDALKKLPPSQPTVTTSQTSSPIWFCWLQGEDAMPSLARLCLDSIRKNSQGHPVVIITEDNHHEYVSLDQIVYDRYHKGRLKKAHFADILRINLLAQHGGLWLDATIYLADQLPAYVFEMPFFSVKTVPTGFFVSQCRWAVFCLASHKGNQLFLYLAELFNEYLRQYNDFIDYFLFDQFLDMLSKRIPDIAQQIEKIPYNNPQLYSLQDLLDSTFDSKTYERIRQNTFLFKLSLKQYDDRELTQNTANFYNHLANLR